MSKQHKIISKHLHNSRRVKDLLAKQREVILVENNTNHNVDLIEDRANDFPHPTNEIWGPGHMPGDRFYRVIGALRNGRDYGEYCTDFIEENALELYLNGVDLGSLGEELKARNPKEFSKINLQETAIYNGLTKEDQMSKKAGTAPEDKDIFKCTDRKCGFQKPYKDIKNIKPLRCPKCKKSPMYNTEDDPNEKAAARRVASAFLEKEAIGMTLYTEKAPRKFVFKSKEKGPATQTNKNMEFAKKGEPVEVLQPDGKWKKMPYNPQKMEPASDKVLKAYNG